MRCAYQCHEIGGPWIAENPECPVHNREAVERDEEHDGRLRAIEARLDEIELRMGMRRK